MSGSHYSLFPPTLKAELFSPDYFKSSAVLYIVGALPQHPIIVSPRLMEINNRRGGYRNTQYENFFICPMHNVKDSVFLLNPEMYNLSIFSFV